MLPPLLLLLPLALQLVLLLGTTEARVLQVKEWDALGPFPVGKTEVDGDVLEANGGLKAVRMKESRDGSRRVADRTTRYFSEVARGGATSWTVARPDAQGNIGVNWGVDWNQHVQWMDNMMVLETQSFFVGALIVPPGEGGAYLLQAQGVHSFTVDGTLCHGDIYSRGELLAPLELAEGAHEVLVRFRARAQGTFRFRAQPAGPSPLQLTQPDFAPDLSSSLLLGEWLPLPVLNAGTAWVEDLRIEASGEEIALHPDYMQPRDTLAPGVLLPIPVRIKLKPDAEGKERKPGDGCITISFTVSGTTSGGKRTSSAPLRVSVRCRKHDEAFLFGFLDHDGSVAHAAAIPPRMVPEPGERVGVMLSFSGVGVTPQKQSESHKYMPKNAKDFAFGYKNMWTLAPEREGAHNWEGVGSRSAIIALDALTHVSARTAYPIFSGDRVHVSGHSRGGHGALVFSTNRPDRSISVSSLSGWYKREYYGDANPLFVLDLQLSHLSPQLKQLLESSIIEHDCGSLMSNLLDIPLLERVGSADTTISPWYTRRMARVMTEHYGLTSGDGQFTGNVSLSEVKKDANGEPAGHWWWDTKTTNDGGVMNDETMRKFLAKAIKSEAKAVDNLDAIASAAAAAAAAAEDTEDEDERDEMGGGNDDEEEEEEERKDALAAVVAAAGHADTLPAFTLSVANPATQHGRYGLRVLQQRHTLRTAQLRVRPSETKGAWWAIEARNVMRFSLRCGKHGGGDGGLAAQATLGLQGLFIDGYGESSSGGGGGDSEPAPFAAPLSAGCKHYCLVAAADAGAASSSSGGGGGGRWADCTDSQFSYKRRERSPLTYGPARQVFMAPFVIVVGTGGASAAENAGLLEIGRYISNSHYAAVQSYAPVMLDTDVKDWGEDDRNMVLIGRPALNAASRWLQQQAAVERRVAAPPVTFLPGGYRIGGCTHRSAGQDDGGGSGGLALGFVTPLPTTAIRFSYAVGGAEAGRLALMLDGVTVSALRSLVKFSFSSNQALTRAAFTNLWPDYMLVGSDYAARGYGGVLEAGYWCAHPLCCLPALLGYLLLTHSAALASASLSFIVSGLPAS